MICPVVQDNNGASSTLNLFFSRVSGMALTADGMIHPFCFRFSFTRTPGGQIHLRSDLAPASNCFLDTWTFFDSLGQYPLTLYHCFPGLKRTGCDSFSFYLSISFARNVYYRRFGSATTFWDFFCFTAFGLTGMRSWGDGFTAYHTTAQMLFGRREGREGNGKERRAHNFFRVIMQKSYAWAARIRKGSLAFMQCALMMNARKRRWRSRGSCLLFPFCLNFSFRVAS
jgi:hypothetical protein